MGNTKNNKYSWIFTLAMAVALGAFIMSSCGSSTLKFFNAHLKKVSPAPQYSLEDFKRETTALHNQYNREIKELHTDFVHQMETTGLQSFQEAENNIDAVMKNFTGYKTTAYMIYLMAYDKITSEKNTQKYIEKYLGPAIIAPCVAGNQAIQNTLEIFLHKLQEKDNAFKAAIAQKLNQLPENCNAADEGRNFISNLTKVNENITDLIKSKMWLSAGLAIEAAFFRQTLQALMNISGKIVTKLSVSLAGAIADGPLPIGDCLAVIGVVWSSYDIYRVANILPKKLRTSIQKSITDYARESRENALKTAEQALEMYIKSSENAIAQVK